MKRITAILCLIIMLLTFNLSTIISKAADSNETENLFDVDYDITREARAVWVSAYVNDISRYKNKSSYKTEINKVLDNMEKFNLNILIFHIRVFNDAFYESKYNPWSSLYNTNPDWDALPWIIEECHKRGIEFHAWMNPYRVSSSTSSSLVELSKKFPQNNPASNPANLVKGSSCVILNPGIPAVQNFLVETCMEVVEKYDVDAIHFDDYFYVQDIEDEATYHEYGTGESIDEFRRNSVTKFIRKLSERIKKYNEENNKAVELGISPTTAWKQGDGIVTYDEDGKAITNGSKGTFQGHYGSYLYCDTLTWINEGLIDYILPQLYKGTSGKDDLFYYSVDWWSKVCKYSKTKFYVGIGIYRAGGNDWANDTELKTQLDYMKKDGGVDGFAIFSYRHLLGSNQSVTNNINNAKEHFSYKALAPIINYDIEVSNKLVKQYYIINENNENTIGIETLDEHKYYVILRKKNGTYTYLGILNNTYKDVVAGYAEYYIAPILKNNELGEYVKLKTTDVYNEYKFLDEDGSYLFSRYALEGEEVSLDKYVNKAGYDFVEWEKVGNNYVAKYEIKSYKITYLVNNEVYNEIYVKYGENAPVLEFDDQYGKFSGWNGNFENVTEDRFIEATYTRPKYCVYYYNGSKLIDKEYYYKGDVLTITKTLDDYDNYEFVGFLKNNELCTSFIVLETTYLTASFKEKTYKITYDLDGGELSFVFNEFTDCEKVILPEAIREGYKFIGWSYNDEIIDVLENQDYNLTAVYKKLYKLTYHNEDNINEVYFENGSEVKLTSLEKDGYKFSHWEDENGKEINNLENQDYELYPCFKKIYHINYNLDGGKCDNLITEFIEDEKVYLETSTKEGYDFLGYYSGNEKIEEIGNQDYELIAKWQKQGGCNNSLTVLYASLALVFMILVRKKY